MTKSCGAIPDPLLAHDQPDAKKFSINDYLSVAARELILDETEPPSIEPGSLIGSYKDCRADLHGVEMGVVLARNNTQ